MTTTIERGTESEARRERGPLDAPESTDRSRALFYFGIVPVFCDLEVHAGVSHSVGLEHDDRAPHPLLRRRSGAPGAAALGSQRANEVAEAGLDGDRLALHLPRARFIRELPWLFFLDQTKQGVQNDALWSYLRSPCLVGGDARDLNGDPLIVTLEWIAVFVGVFEAYAVVEFFRKGSDSPTINWRSSWAG